MCTSCISRGSGWRIHCGVEVTALSTNKQLSLEEQVFIKWACDESDSEICICSPDEAGEESGIEENIPQKSTENSEIFNSAPSTPSRTTPECPLRGSERSPVKQYPLSLIWRVRRSVGNPKL